MTVRTNYCTVCDAFTREPCAIHPPVNAPRFGQGARIARADDGSRSPAIPFGSLGTVLRVVSGDTTSRREVVVVEWDAAPGGTYVYPQDDARICRPVAL